MLAEESNLHRVLYPLETGPDLLCVTVVGITKRLVIVLLKGFPVQTSNANNHTFH